LCADRGIAECAGFYGVALLRNLALFPLFFAFSLMPRFLLAAVQGFGEIMKRLWIPLCLFAPFAFFLCCSSLPFSGPVEFLGACVQMSSLEILKRWEVERRGVFT